MNNWSYQHFSDEKKCLILSYVNSTIMIWFRYSGAPVDFEQVEINGEMTDPDYMRDVLLSVGRNGVAIKGSVNPFL